MKNLLIAAVVAGVALAGVILYVTQNDNSTSGLLVDRNGTPLLH